MSVISLDKKHVDGEKHCLCSGVYCPELTLTQCPIVYRFDYTRSLFLFQPMTGAIKSFALVLSSGN